MTRFKSILFKQFVSALLAAILIFPIQVLGGVEEIPSVENSGEKPQVTSGVQNYEPNGEKPSESVSDNAGKSSQTEVRKDNFTILKNAAYGDIPPEPPPVDNPLERYNKKQPIPEADVASGALTYQIKIPVPAGRMGIQPDLNLAYNSLNNELGGSVGYGWDLSIPSIERRNVNGANKLYTSRDFTSTMGGELREQTAGTFVSRVDMGSAIRFEFLGSGNSQYWKATDKQGKRFLFGESANSKLSNPNDDTKIFRWYLTNMMDRNGNSVDFVYQKFSGQVYLREISYTNHPSLSGVFKVTFEYEDRPDLTFNANPGFLVSSDKRLTRIKGFFLNQLTNETELSYTQHPVNNRTLLRTVRNIGYDTQGQPASQGFWKFDYDSVGASGLLTGLELPTGGKMLITYIPSAQVIDNSTNARGNSKLPYSFYLVETIEFQEGDSPSWQNEFQYIGGSFYYANPFDKRVAGFEKVTQTDGSGNTTATYYHQGNGNNPIYSEFGDAFEKLGRPYKVEVRSASGDLYTQTLNRWEYISVGDQVARTQLKSVLTRTFDGDKSSKDSAVEYIYDSLGNILRETKLGEVSGSDDGTYEDRGSDTIISEMGYAVPLNPNTYVIGLPSHNRILDAANQKQSETFYFYDGLTLNSVDKGNLAKEQRWIAATSFAENNRIYNEFGQIVVNTDPNNHSTNYTFDQFNLYPTLVSNALNHTMQYAYDYSSGGVTQTIDPNGSRFETDYDGLDRVVEERQPNAADPTGLVVKSASVYNDQPNNTSVKLVVSLNESLITESYIYLDGFGRKAQERLQTEQTNQFAARDFAYDNRSLLVRESLPYFSVGSARTAATSESSLYATYSYDPVKRISAIANAVGTTQTSYDRSRTIVTDPLGKQRILTNDAFNRLVRVDEKNALETYVTSYDYNPLGSLIRITDAQGNVRNFSYDGLGRRTIAEDLHVPKDATFGIWTFAYDKVGNLTQQIDPKNQVVRFDYDELNRVLKEDSLGQAGVEVTYAYDKCPEGIGRLCSDSNSNITRTREYNALGQTIKEAAAILSANYETRYEFDRQGNITLLTNPDNSQIKYEYSQAGLLERLLHKESTNPTFSILVSNFDYAPTQDISEITYASGARTINSYDPNELYRLRRKLTNNGTGQNVQDLNYTFDAVGNVRKIVDNSDLNTRKTLTYFYDDLHRLIWASANKVIGGGNYDQQYSYDALGNFTVKSDEGNYIYGGSQGQNFANPHAVTQIERVGQMISLSYDKNGNIEHIGNSVSYFWDYKNRLMSATNGSVVSNYGYAPDGARVSYVTGSSTTLFPTKFFNISSGNVLEKNIFAGSMLIATIKGTGQQANALFTHSDHLTSANVVTDMNGATKESLDYFPFGEIRVDSGPAVQKRKFAGHEYDLDMKLSFMGARYYDGAKGRFLSIDPVFLSVTAGPSDPQSLNAYAYARNNPLRYIDPDGKWFKDLIMGRQSFGSFAVEVGDAANYLYDNNRLWRTAMDHPYTTGAIVGAASGLAATGIVAAAPEVVSAASELTAKQVARATTGAGLNMANTYFTNKAGGRDTSAYELVISGAFGTVGAFSPQGVVKSALFAGRLNIAQQAITQQDIDLTQASISMGSAGFGSWLFGTRLLSENRNALSTKLAEQVVVWTAETSGQVINSGLRNEKKERR